MDLKGTGMTKKKMTKKELREALLAKMYGASPMRIHDLQADQAKLLGIDCASEQDQTVAYTTDTDGTVHVETHDYPHQFTISGRTYSRANRAYTYVNESIYKTYVQPTDNKDYIDVEARVIEPEPKALTASKETETDKDNGL